LPLKWWILRVVLHFLHIYMRLREDQRFSLQKGVHGLRQAALQVGRRLFPGDPQAIFFLTLAEVQDCASQAASAGPLLSTAQERRRDFEKIQRLAAPVFLKGNQPYLPAAQHALIDGHVAMRGVPVSPGKGRGHARVMAGPEDLERVAPSVQPGDILVTKSTDPAWTPILLKLGGLVMETGGALSHGAVIAREYGIPAVVGLVNATQEIVDGELLEVDGSQGLVIRLG
jgi:pyruvate,water dikinase